MLSAVKKNLPVDVAVCTAAVQISNHLIFKKIKLKKIKLKKIWF